MKIETSFSISVGVLAAVIAGLIYYYEVYQKKTTEENQPK